MVSSVSVCFVVPVLEPVQELELAGCAVDAVVAEAAGVCYSADSGSDSALDAAGSAGPPSPLEEGRTLRDVS